MAREEWKNKGLSMKRLTVKAKGSTQITKQNAQDIFNGYPNSYYSV